MQGEPAEQRPPPAKHGGNPADLELDQSHRKAEQAGKQADLRRAVPDAREVQREYRDDDLPRNRGEKPRGAEQAEPDI